jgi:proteasome lid subunit RPN8/RPN11
MRWTEQAPALPLQSLDALADSAPPLAALLATTADGLLVGVAAAAGEAVLQHLADHGDERGGLLLGEVFAAECTIAGSRVVHVTQAVAAEDCFGTGVSLRMSSAVWDAARGRLRPREMIVGWYHSHPDLGAFFSWTDRRTQRAFFPHAYSVGWVVDPLRRESQWFVAPPTCRPRTSRVRRRRCPRACTRPGQGSAAPAAVRRDPGGWSARGRRSARRRRRGGRSCGPSTRSA